MGDVSPAIEQLKQAIGMESKPYVNEVERGAILRFAEAIEDPNPQFNDEATARKTPYGGLVAPPTFLRFLKHNPLPVQSLYGGTLDGGSEWEYYEPVRPGDRITVTLRLADVWERSGSLGPMLFSVNEFTYENQLGQLVATQRATSISYGGAA